jgi:hypothetical protein
MNARRSESITKHITRRKECQERTHRSSWRQTNNQGERRGQLPDERIHRLALKQHRSESSGAYGRAVLQSQGNRASVNHFLDLHRNWCGISGLLGTDSRGRWMQGRLFSPGPTKKSFCLNMSPTLASTWHTQGFRSSFNPIERSLILKSVPKPAHTSHGMRTHALKAG